MICSTLRFGKGATSEIGYDLRNLGARKTLVVTDKRVATTRAFTAVAESLHTVGVNFDVFDRVKVEPSDASRSRFLAQGRLP
jgi:hydroxyacid-oxoacid transhydrogenase